MFVSLRKIARGVTFAAMLAALPAPGVFADVIVFSDDFDGGQTTSLGVSGAFSGITTTESVQSYAGIGTGSNQFGGDFLRNATGGTPNIGDSGLFTTLTLTNLPTHTAISLKFLLATIDSWDGVDGNPLATGDYFNVRVDGVEVFEASFAQLSGSRANAYQAPSGGELSFGSNLFGITLVNDAAYDMGLESALSNIAHTASTLTIDLFADGPGWQGGRNFSTGIPQSDESWAVDNLSVSLTTAIPEPGSGLLLLAGMIALPVLRRKKR